MAFCMYCGAAIEEGKEHVCAGSGNPQAANMDFSNVNMGGVQQNTNVVPENNVAQQNVNGIPMNNGMGQNVNGMAMNNGMGQNVNGMPMNNGMGQNVNGMPMNNGMGQNMNGMPMDNGMGQNMNGMPMNNGMGQNMNGMPTYNGMPQNSQFNQQFNQASRQAGNYVGELFKSWTSILKSPIEEGKKFVEKASVGLSIGLLVIQALFTVIFVMMCFQGMGINIAKAFFISLLGSAVFSAAFVGVFYLVVKMFKGEISFTIALAVTGARAVPISVMQAAAVVVLLLAKASVSPVMVYAAFAVWFFSAVAGVVFVTQVAFEHTGLDSAKIFWAMVVILALVGIVDAIVYRVGLPLYFSGENANYINMMFQALGGGSGYSGYGSSYYGW